MKVRFLFAIVVAISLTAAGCSSESDDPASVLERYADTRTAGDVDALMAFYADNAVVTGHPLDGDGTATGLQEIRTLEGQVPGIQGSSGFTKYRVIEVSGDVVTFNSRFVNSDGECFSGSGHKATVVDGKITVLAFGTGEEDQCS